MEPLAQKRSLIQEDALGSGLGWCQKSITKKKLPSPTKEHRKICALTRLH